MTSSTTYLGDEDFGITKVTKNIFSGAGHVLAYDTVGQKMDKYGSYGQYLCISQTLYPGGKYTHKTWIGTWGDPAPWPTNNQDPCGKKSW